MQNVFPHIFSANLSLILWPFRNMGPCDGGQFLNAKTSQRALMQAVKWMHYALPVVSINIFLTNKANKMYITARKACVFPKNGNSIAVG